MFQRILVGVDGSETALRAVDVAAGLAAVHGARLLLVHVVQISEIAEQAIKASPTDHMGENPKRIMEQLSQGILDAARARALDAGVPEDRIAAFSADGNQAKRLIEAARQHEADLMVVGSRGRGRLEGLLLGSVSQKAAALTPCPCLIVR